MTPSWILKETVLAIHDEVLAEHGGLSGLKDENLLDSALARPQHTYAYLKADVFILAASYAYGLCNNHPFLDGNKRTAFVVCSLFLRLSGYNLAASKEDKIQTFLKLASSKISEKQLEQWLRKNAKEIFVM